MTQNSQPEANQAGVDDEVYVGNQTRPDTQYIQGTIELETHNMRGKISLWLTVAVTLVIIIPIVAVIISPQNASAIKDVITSIFPGVIGMYGTVIGFYFGKSK